MASRKKTNCSGNSDYDDIGMSINTLKIEDYCLDFHSCKCRHYFLAGDPPVFFSVLCFKNSDCERFFYELRKMAAVDDRFFYLTQKTAGKSR